jgi:hypothetical protein
VTAVYNNPLFYYPYDIAQGERPDMIADRYYNDFPMLNVWDSNGVFFVIRHKHNLKYTVLNERDLPQNTAQNVLIDQEIELVQVFSKFSSFF